MQLLSTFVATAVSAAAIALVLAEQEVHVKLHVSQDKFYVTPIGDQCAFNSCVDPSVYPCANGVCVRLNYTYGICSNDAEDMSAEQDYDDPKLLCPYPNPYNSKLGSLSDDEESYDSYDSEE
ncbi:uncharacterized protein KRP23_4268 [Phytophthora ramorum]|uniref:Uncharacterized protein n=1 Tax=Phytophthora ramorum TaxID=164328 RepID=H3G9D7_PHYRM|nr:hypothetical protein KRP23_4268 [Phytophthora ramorum]